MPIFPTTPSKAKLIAALMAADEQLIKKALTALESAYGAVELSSRVFPFTYSDYYKHEMGSALLKVFCSFSRLIEPDELVSLKLSAIEIEKQFLRGQDTLGSGPQGGALEEGRAGRTVNIDPGYLDRMKLVLATTKDCSHRLYLGKGIFGDIELMYRSGSFACLEWTYPDYREKLAIEFFNGVRSKYLAELKGEERQTP